VQIARETLWVMRNDPTHLFLCGPMALKTLMLAQRAAPQETRLLDRYRAGPQGASLAELARLAEEANLPYRPVFREAGQAVPVPSIVHWKVGHFAAILGEADGRFYVKDPVLGQDGLWVTKMALDHEASGYFWPRRTKRMLRTGGWSRPQTQAECGELEPPTGQDLVMPAIRSRTRLHPHPSIAACAATTSRN
jgi:hypothetical protein